MRSSILIFDLLAHRTQSSSVIWVFAAQMILSSLFGWVFGILLTTVLGIPFDRCDAALPTSSKTTKSISKNINGSEVQKKKKKENEKINFQKKHKRNQKGGKDISTARTFGIFFKCIVVGGLGFLMFVMGHMFDPYMQPLITCMVGGFIVGKNNG